MRRSVNYRVKMEKENELEDKKRPDIGVYDFQEGKKLPLVITVILSLSLIVVTQSANVNRNAAIARDKVKNNKYLNIATSLGYLFNVTEIWLPLRVHCFSEETSPQLGNRRIS